MQEREPRAGEPAAGTSEPARGGDAAPSRAGGVETAVTLRLADFLFAVSAGDVREILRAERIVRIPDAPAAVRGVITLRGRVLPVVDLRRRLGFPQTELGAKHRILVAAPAGRLVGLLVDGVDRLAQLDRSRLQPPPRQLDPGTAPFVLGAQPSGDRQLLLLDLARVLDVRE